MKQISVIWISIMLAFSSALLLMDVSEDIEGKVAVNNRVGYETHAPIRIDSNAEFDEVHGVVNWATGDGSVGNPWIIEGWDINGSGYGYCIFVGNTTEFFEVRDCYLHHASGPYSSPYYTQSGLIVYNGQNCTIANNNITSNPNHGFNLLSSSNNTIINNTASNNFRGIYLRYSSYNTLANNNASSNTDCGILLYSSSNNMLMNNNASNNDDGIRLNQYNYNNIIANNTVSSNTDYGVWLWLSDSNTLTNNTIYSNNYYGIFVQDSDNNTITNNTASDNHSGIILYLSSSRSLTNNTASSNNFYGIFIWDSDNNTIANNNASDNLYGIYLDDYSNDNSFVNNTASNNDYGIFLNDYSNDNSIFNNIVSNNLNGINLGSSNGNTIYHNKFINNTIQASDNTGANQWHNGYPSGGNYWDDYTGFDFNSTSAQNVPPPDGIGDTPYTNIDGGVGAQDNYPLMMQDGRRINVITLSEGWNLLSLPLKQSDDSLDQVLSSIAGKWDCIQIYDGLSLELWKTNNTYKPDQLNDISTLNHKMGFWINITEPNVNLTVSGYIPTPTSIPLYAGWNLVGYPSLNTETVANALWGTGADRVEVFDPAEPYRIRDAGPTYVMKPGEGYWVHVPADTTWIIEW